jgi:hypothetical protein
MATQTQGVPLVTWRAGRGRVSAGCLVGAGVPARPGGDTGVALGRPVVAETVGAARGVRWAGRTRPGPVSDRLADADTLARSSPAAGGVRVGAGRAGLVTVRALGSAGFASSAVAILSATASSLSGRSSSVPSRRLGG